MSQPEVLFRREILADKLIIVSNIDSMAVEAALDELFSPSSSYNREDYRICRERVHVPEEKARVSGMNFGERNRELDSLQAHRRPLLAGSNTSEHQAFGLGSGFRPPGLSQCFGWSMRVKAA
jgi:hypothetical protein